MFQLQTSRGAAFAVLMVSFVLAACGQVETTSSETDDPSDGERAPSEQPQRTPAPEEPARDGTVDPPLGRSTPGQSGQTSAGPRRPPE
jgi:hypothetical protein